MIGHGLAVALIAFGSCRPSENVMGLGLVGRTLDALHMREHARGQRSLIGLQRLTVEYSGSTV